VKSAEATGAHARGQTLKFSNIHVKSRERRKEKREKRSEKKEEKRKKRKENKEKKKRKREKRRKGKKALLYLINESILAAEIDARIHSA